ncbi:unnamed protein product [Moneuplotes crassus]|uniref:Uncharacterized protein n=1 Tax=Euplotes crassus TaxID=5936 RepID=A0AAD1Y942_EUPCR|nr:unnamed protein product [Moneuplotes crassus]
MPVTTRNSQKSILTQEEAEDKDEVVDEVADEVEDDDEDLFDPTGSEQDEEEEVSSQAKLTQGTGLTQNSRVSQRTTRSSKNSSKLNSQVTINSEKKAAQVKKTGSEKVYAKIRLKGSADLEIKEFDYRGYVDTCNLSQFKATEQDIRSINFIIQKHGYIFEDEEEIKDWVKERELRLKVAKGLYKGQAKGANCNPIQSFEFQQAILKEVSKVKEGKHGSEGPKVRRSIREQKKKRDEAFEYDIDNDSKLIKDDYKPRDDHDSDEMQELEDLVDERSNRRSLRRLLRNLRGREEEEEEKEEIKEEIKEPAKEFPVKVKKKTRKNLREQQYQDEKNLQNRLISLIKIVMSKISKIKDLPEINSLCEEELSKVRNFQYESSGNFLNGFRKSITEECIRILPEVEHDKLRSFIKYIDVLVNNIPDQSFKFSIARKKRQDLGIKTDSEEGPDGAKSDENVVPKVVQDEAEKKIAELEAQVKKLKNIINISDKSTKIIDDEAEISSESEQEKLVRPPINDSFRFNLKQKLLKLKKEETCRFISFLDYNNISCYDKETRRLNLDLNIIPERMIRKMDNFLDKILNNKESEVQHLISKSRKRSMKREKKGLTNKNNGRLFIRAKHNPPSASTLEKVKELNQKIKEDNILESSSSDSSSSDNEKEPKNNSDEAFIRFKKKQDEIKEKEQQEEAQKAIKKQSNIGSFLVKKKLPETPIVPHDESSTGVHVDSNKGSS